MKWVNLYGCTVAVFMFLLSLYSYGYLQLVPQYKHMPEKPATLVN